MQNLPLVIFRKDFSKWLLYVVPQVKYDLWKKGLTSSKFFKNTWIGRHWFTFLHISYRVKLQRKDAVVDAAPGPGGRAAPAPPPPPLWSSRSLRLCRPSHGALLVNIRAGTKLLRPWLESIDEYLSGKLILGSIDQITIKTPNPQCRLYWCLIEFIGFI